MIPAIATTGLSRGTMTVISPSDYYDSAKFAIFQSIKAEKLWHSKNDSSYTMDSLDLAIIKFSKFSLWS